MTPMTSEGRAPHFGRLLIGVGLGVLGTIAVSLLAIVGLVLLIAIPVALIAASLAGVVRPSRTPEAAGVLLGAGAILLYAAMRSAASCPGGNDACGDPNSAPLVVTALAMLGGGAASAVAAYRRRD